MPPPAWMTTGPPSVVSTAETDRYERIESMPELYSQVWQDVRAARLRKFRHLVYYVVFADRVEVLAVMHGSRHASTWQSRR